ncbi:hypothetical protein BD779DRAFT_1477101 [Infundibulicybe gibba]|nr:hypothetical protein BD779DRAFT_1477101 [Infundibulicybe gibba]
MAAGWTSLALRIAAMSGDDRFILGHCCDVEGPRRWWDSGINFSLPNRLRSSIAQSVSAIRRAAWVPFGCQLSGMAEGIHRSLVGKKLYSRSQHLSRVLWRGGGCDGRKRMVGLGLRQRAGEESPESMFEDKARASDTEHKPSSGVRATIRQEIHQMVETEMQRYPGPSNLWLMRWMVMGPLHTSLSDSDDHWTARGVISDGSVIATAHIYLQRQAVLYPNGGRWQRARGRSGGLEMYHNQARSYISRLGRECGM